MARYKDTDTNQGLFLAVNLKEQLVPGTFEYTLNKILDEMELSCFDGKYQNDITGATAIEPRVLLKIILYCYSLGIISSRKIARMCEINLVVKALSGDTEPHYTTISNFISGMEEEAHAVFSKVVTVCYKLGLVGGKTFAIDGCKLSSNASKEWSGTKKELRKKYEQIKKQLKRVIAEHKENDVRGTADESKEKEKVKELKHKAQRILEFLEGNEGKQGAGGKEVKSNVTDNESGKIKGPHGMIQGYNGIAAADGKNQVVIAVEVLGSVAEGQSFPVMLDKLETEMKEISGKEEGLKKALILADTGYFSEDNLQAAKERGVEVIIPDPQFRNRDELLKEGERRKGKERYDERSFKYMKEGDYYICPAKKKLVFRKFVKLNRNEGKKYDSTVVQCRGCPHWEKCIRGKKKQYRTLYIPVSKYEENLSQKMREKIDKPKQRKRYSQRMQIIEPVFADIEYCKGMDRFTMTGKKKVQVQWELYCVVHNIGKCIKAKKLKKVV
jgi:transposase